jgi:hypothetical protein
MILAVTSAGGATVTVVPEFPRRRIPGRMERNVSILRILGDDTEPDQAIVLVALGSATR